MIHPRLLVSVRSPEEAEAALRGGADLIDIKEPGRGPLGRADTVTIERIIRVVAGKRPVSAAMGELVEHLPSNGDRQFCGLTFVKWGLAGCQYVPDWRLRLTQAMKEFEHDSGPAQLVPVAYADARNAQAPRVAEVVEFACRHSTAALLIDTWDKRAGRTLLDWLSVRELSQLCRHCHAYGVPLALAGSLGPDEITQLWQVETDWFAVRGAACARGRTSSIRAAKVRRLAGLLQSVRQPARLEG